MMCSASLSLSLCAVLAALSRHRVPATLPESEVVEPSER